MQTAGFLKSVCLETHIWSRPWAEDVCERIYESFPEKKDSIFTNAFIC